MAVITVMAAGDTVYRVTVAEGASETRHEVILTPAVSARYAPGVPPARLIEASFEFLLAREPKEAILLRFDLPVIERYFPDYPRRIRAALGGN